MFRALVLLFFLILPVRTAFAVPSVEALLSKNKIHAGETAELQIKIEWPKQEGVYGFGLPGIPLKNLTITNRAESEESFFKGSEEWIRKIFTLELSAAQPGEGRIDSFYLTYVNPANPDSAGQLSVPSFDIKVTKPPLKIPAPFLWIAGLLSAALALAAILLKILQKKAAAEAAVPTPEAQAIQRFKASVENKNAASADTLYTLSREFREFVAAFYKTGSPNHSESEMIADLQKGDLTPEELKNLQKILEALKEAKFTGSFRESDFEQLKREILNFVEGKRVIAKMSF